MEVFKFGFKYWKKYLPGDILTKLMSCIALSADLMLPLIASMFINYAIQSNEVKDDNIFSFLLNYVQLIIE